MADSPRQQADRRQQAADAKRTHDRAETRHALLVRAGVGTAALLAVAGIVTLGALTGKQSAGNTTSPVAGPVDATTVVAAATTGRSDLPPWPNATSPVAAVKVALLVPAGSEGAAEHYHAHLDVFVDGKAVPVAAEIGADDAAHLISPLHTHDASGVVHVEAPTVGTPYYLGQLFREWDVALSQQQLGALHADATHTLTTYVNGAPFAGDPASIQFAAHQEIALVYGTTEQSVAVPAGYAFGSL